MPTLYIVSTPIGNLEDITLRALRVLGEVGLIAAEDTRVTRRLLARYEIDTPLTSYHEHNKLAKIPELVSRLEEIDIALVSDAGTPGVNDPGQELVSAAAAQGYDVIGIPGPSAVTTAISLSGIAMEGFIYLGFLPRKQGQRKRLLESAVSEGRALVMFETPHRLRSALSDALSVLGDRQLAVCRELTKLYEEVFRGTISESLDHFGNPRGEFTLVISGATTADENAPI
ncbi:MAG: 16S rRNA (cytidine(1402)-2'-O)-methyltransferase, partial [SAR202 cluster bacterium]|nr:16S rRNA (cytidine(1402)-2'-O)-methyltransferase [SAR202 cluster bacterium]